VQHTAESGFIWGDNNNELSPVIQGYWTSFIRSKDPNKFRKEGTPEWGQFDGGVMGRILFPNEAGKVRMETVPADQRARCAFLNSIGGQVSQ